MTVIINAKNIENAIRRSGLTWLLRYWGDSKDENLEKTAADLSAFIEHYDSQFHDRPDPIRLLEDDPVKGRAFFQFDTLIMSNEMKTVIWRILLGCEIKQVDFHYDRDGIVSLSVQLIAPHGGSELYKSSFWADFRVLRHLGSLKRGNSLRLEGYWATKE